LNRAEPDRIWAARFTVLRRSRMRLCDYHVLEYRESIGFTVPTRV
jgi:hypothetical protein